MVKKLSIIFSSVFVLTILLSGRADAQVNFQDTIVVNMELPGGGFSKVDTLLEGETFMLTGFAHPFQYLNGGQLSFPDSSLPENVTLNIQVPGFAAIGEAAVSFGDNIASGVSFQVTPQDSAGPVNPYVFDLPVELILPIPANLPPSIGTDVSTFVLAFRDTSGNFDTTGVSTTIRDAVKSIVSAQVEHFSDIVMTSESLLEGGVVSISDNKGLIPEEYSLDQNYPNPFNPITSIRFALPEATDMVLIVYDLLGREVVRLVDGHYPAGYQAVVWNGKAVDGREVPTGVYIARMETPEFSRSIKMLLLK